MQPGLMGTRPGMTTTPGEQTESDERPDEVPQQSPSRPHGDPVAPDPDQTGDNSAATTGNPSDPQAFPATDPEAEADTNAQPGQKPASADTDINA
jgi:hypothetical protein